jgi:hypothetical protein
VIARAAAALAVAAGGCSQGPALTADCGGSLAGVWRAPSGRWQALEGRGRIELYPIDREPAAVLPPGVMSAPAAIDLTRGSAGLTGTLTRRFERGAQFCRVTTPIAAVACGGGALTLTVHPPAPPSDWTTCAAPTAPAEPLILRR